MKTYKQLAMEYGVHYMTIRNWIIKSGITPDFLAPSDSPRRRGYMTVLTPEKQLQLHDWCVATGRVKLGNAGNK